MVHNRELGVTEAKVVVVVPEGNRAYRERVTSPSLAMALLDQTVSGIVEQTLVHSDRAYASVSQSNLADSVWTVKPYPAQLSDWLSTRGIRKV